MNSLDKAKLKKYGDGLCRLVKLARDEQPTNPWYKVEYRQGVIDCLRYLKVLGIIAGYDIDNGVTLPGEATNGNKD